MPYSGLLRGFLRTMSLRPSPLKPFFSQNPKPQFSFVASKPLSLRRGGGGRATFGIPLRRSLVIAASSPTTTRSLDSDRGESLGPVFSPRPPVLPFSRQQSLQYGRYAYDDYSEDESDGDAASASLQKVRFVFEFLLNLKNGGLEIVNLGCIWLPLLFRRLKRFLVFEILADLSRWTLLHMVFGWNLENWNTSSQYIKNNLWLEGIFND